MKHYNPAPVRASLTIGTMFTVSSLLPVVLYLVVAVSQLHVSESSGGKWIQQEPTSTKGAIDQKILDKHHSLREHIIHTHNSPHRWQPSNSSYVVPFLDKVGICTVTNHILQSQKKHSGGILFIGDDTENIATVRLASVLEPHMTSLSCSNKACTYSVCGKDVVTKLSYVSMKKFMHDSCIHSDVHKNQHCDDRLFAATMSNYDIIVFGMSPVVAKIHAANSTNDIAHEVRAIANWMNNNFTSVVQADGVQGTTLFLYQTAWPTETYCATGESGPRKKERYQQLQTHDQFLWNALSTGALSKMKSLTLQRIDLSEVVAAREELYLRDSSNSGSKRSHCEQYTGRSDSIQLLLNTVYGAILDHVHPHTFPRAVSGFLTKEDYTQAIQRVALTEVSVLNYLTALHTIQAARNKGWRLPQDTAVTLTLTDIRYYEHFPFWYHSRRQYGVEGIMIGMDNETCTHLVEHYQDFLYLCMHVPETMRMAPPYKQTVFVGVGKIIYPLLFLVEHNMSVIFSEMDVFWKNNPFPFFAQVSNPLLQLNCRGSLSLNCVFVNFITGGSQGL